MPRLLKDLKIDDVSSVDRGAGRGVRVLLTKRDADELEHELEKAWSDEARQAAAEARRRGASPTWEFEGPTRAKPGEGKTYRHITSGKEIVSTVHPGASWRLVKIDDVDLEFLVDAEKIWASNDELPPGVKNNLPGEAQSVFRRVANDRMKAGASDESAIKQAWTAVKNGWSKQGDKWVRKDWDEDNYSDSVTKREFSTAERESAAESGAAMPHGGYPIKNKGDLKNAIQAIGRAKDRDATMAHIKRRARALGATDMLPESWGKRDGIAEIEAELEALNKDDFNTAQDNIEVCEDVNELICDVNDAICALQASLCSIMEDDDVADKRTAVGQSFDQFKTYMASCSFDGADDDAEVEKSDFGEFEPIEKAESDMAIKLPEKLQAIVDEAVSKAVADQDAKVKALTDTLAKKDEEIAKLGMNKDQQSYYDNLQDEDQKKRFRGMSPSERDDHMSSTRKRYGEDPIYKQQQDEIAKLTKRLEAVEYEREYELAKVEARDLGMRGEKDPDVVLKMKRSCDAETYEIWKQHIKTLQKSRDAFMKESRAFNELGTLQGNNTGSALDELNAKAAELHKAKPETTLQKAFDMVYADPGNRDLVMREKEERMAKIHRVAV